MDADREEKMKFSKKDIRMVLLHEFLLGHTATEVVQIYAIQWVRMWQRWFKRFKKGNYELDDLPRSGK